ncbi:hypothetical protein [Pseudonocardia sp. HH130630-07]|uniref:hypothetical protein n=1 Tax=Pseudonocardia sp. HH130630-07 TaxID=1690815 RepID=UPI000814BF42|nr:hypothetical protein [Pseudonocardia sp. HH130630-07]ANY08237.1 hypothetical protein AFB00_20345 [Pseudonocardia sp. HH130630-07]
MTTPTTWPGLGFDPAPGNPAQVRSLAEGLTALRAPLDEARTTIEPLRTPERFWTGDAAQAFGTRTTALTRSGETLLAWHGFLETTQRTARELEATALELRNQLATAQTAAGQAARNPDLDLVNRVCLRFPQGL